MFIPNEQLEREPTPLAYRITIRLVSNRLATERNSLENLPDRAQRKSIEKTIHDKIGFSGHNLLALNVCKRRLELIIEAPAETKKIINCLTICIIEILKKTGSFSDKINLWQPETKTQHLQTFREIETAIKSIKNERELALRTKA